ncbi:acyl-CoA/acyl-ACP dehydrogenase [Amycolatopsis sp. K13G38]|uniref:Acyl-CoA/acyl-ACP dehydrogenase n=1 Tax=Amycolatopsis acididurans TaxID=2724524 RepID=A0ABX1IY44_9PSEU|nr:acyl-CoA dehydrogenase family protein [Amycolatopsis acididurans]NKQ52412.1 acyl-CoA/acyl-ACP dehydrogenase [Amycolatopsis acididurans]
MMLEPTGEQLAFQAEVRRYLQRSWPTALSRVAVDGGAPFDRDAWAGLAVMGATGLLVPPEFGGADAGVTEAAFVCEELGRLVVAAPYLSTAVLAPRLLTALADEVAMRRYLPGIADGTTIATVAHLDSKGRWTPGAITVRAGCDGEGWRLDGRVPYVTDLPSADLVLVLATAPDGLGVFAVPVHGQGVTVRLLDCLDRTQPLGGLDFAAAGAVRLGADRGHDAVVAAVNDAMAAALACLAAGQVGGAEQCLELSAAYAGQRVQFGRIIGSYQAIKHKCADMLARVESARSAAHHLIHAVETRSPELATAISLASAFCSDAYTQCAADMLQIHGGIGFTWEHDTHLYLRRAKASAHLFGDPVHHRQVLADQVIGSSGHRS